MINLDSNTDHDNRSQDVSLYVYYNKCSLLADVVINVRSSMHIQFNDYETRNLAYVKAVGLQI